MASYARTTFTVGLAALLVGGTLGIGTVQGVRPQQAAAEPLYPRAPARVESPSVDEADFCTDCTGFDEGYHWASVMHIAETDDCLGDDWSRQSGCLAYVRARGLD